LSAHRDDLGHELAVERLEAQLGRWVREHLRAQWDAVRAGEVWPGWASELAHPRWHAQCARARHTADAKVGARATRLWRLATRLRVDADPAVRAAAARADTESGLAALAEARNRIARSLGFDHYGALVGALEHVAAPGEGAAVEPVARQAAHGSTDAGLAWLASLGVEVGGVRWELRDGARPTTFAVDAPGDVRVVVPRPVSAGDWHAYAHEAGHAWLARSHDPNLPWSLRDAPTRLDHEAVAEWVARATDSDAFAEAVLGADRTSAGRWARARLDARRVRRARRCARAIDEWRLYAELEPLRGTEVWSAPARAQLVADPGAQLLYGAMDARADQLERRFGAVTNGTAAAAFRTTLGRAGAREPWVFAV
jgi:hypothetical protein